MTPAEIAVALAKSTGQLAVSQVEFRDAVAGLSNYRRGIAWAHVRQLEQHIELLGKLRIAEADAYEALQNVTPINPAEPEQQGSGE